MLTVKNFKFKKPGPYTMWRIINWVALGLMLASIILTCYFIYRYIYRTLDDANTILLLNSTFNIENADLDSFNQVEQTIEVKASLPANLPPLRNIFFYSSSTSPLPATTALPNGT